MAETGDANTHDQAAGSPTQRIEFARETLRSIQLLISLLDQKAYLVLVITSVTCAAFFTIVGAFLGKLDALISPLIVVPLSAAWFLIEAGLVLWYSLKSIQGVVARKLDFEAPGMVFPHSLVHHHGGDPKRYFERLRGVSDEDILRDYSAEILKTSNIFIEKARQVNDAATALYRSMIPWITGILATIVLRVL